jgi:hypothetical protein
MVKKRQACHLDVSLRDGPNYQTVAPTCPLCSSGRSRGEGEFPIPYSKFTIPPAME